MIDAILSLLIQLNNLLGGHLGITLIVIGIGIRAVFTPLIRSQLNHSQKMRDIQPQLNALKKKYKDKTQLAQAQTKLFQEAGINPVAGCLPLIIQIVVFIVLFQAITRLFNQGINTQFLWLDLAKPDLIAVSGLPFAIPGFFILLAGITQLILSKMMMPHPVPVHTDDNKQEKEEKVDLMTEIAQAQSQMIYLFPIMFVLFGYNYPAGLAIYWSASTITAIIQQWYIAGLGGLETWLRKPPPEIVTVALPSKSSKK